MPPPPSLLTPFTIGRSMPEGVDSKTRRWLDTIPIGDDRSWDDAQIAGLVDFAVDRHLEHLPAEDIYKRYVEYQVESARNV